jgi:hypothetical protein
MADDIRQLRQPEVDRVHRSVAVDICKYLPKAYQGSIIITTRSSLVKIGHRIQVAKRKNLQDSLEILSIASSREGLINGKAFD